LNRNERRKKMVEVDVADVKVGSKENEERE